MDGKNNATSFLGAVLVVLLIAVWAVAALLGGAALIKLCWLWLLA